MLPILRNPFRSISRLDPFREFDGPDTFATRRLVRDADNALDMRMEISEDEKAYHVTMDIPGVKKEDIDVSVEGNRVVVRAQIDRSKEEGTGTAILYSERLIGTGYRSFSLPLELDSRNAVADYDGGVLTLSLPKKHDGEVNRVQVTSPGKGNDRH